MSNYTKMTLTVNQYQSFRIWPFNFSWSFSEVGFRFFDSSIRKFIFRLSQYGTQCSLLCLFEWVSSACPCMVSCLELWDRRLQSSTKSGEVRAFIAFDEWANNSNSSISSRGNKSDHLDCPSVPHLRTPPMLSTSQMRSVIEGNNWEVCMSLRGCDGSEVLRFESQLVIASRQQQCIR